MLLIEKIQNVFPRATDIPETLFSDIPCIQTGYLVDGEIQVWDGPRQEVLSSVWVVGSMDPKPFFIGEYPLLTEVEALKILFVEGGIADMFPFTGRKDSAEGTLSVSDALRVFSIRTLVAAKQTELNKQIITRIVRDHKSKFLATDFIL